MSLGFGIVGHGFMGHQHEAELKDFDGIQLIGICDKDPGKLKDVQEGILCYSSAQEMFKNPEIQVVVIAANNNQHKQLVIDAARAGKDIICEKPAALYVADLDEMVQEVEKCGRKFTVHQQRRYDKDFRTAKEVYDSKTLGSIYTIKSSLYGCNGNVQDWHAFLSEGGGMLYDWGVHLLDQILWMVDGKVTSVYATVKNVVNQEVDDYFDIFLKFENGVGAEIELGTYYLSDKENWFERHWFLGGNKGSAYIDGFDAKGKIVRTVPARTGALGYRQAVGAAVPVHAFGPIAANALMTEELPQVYTSHRDFYENYLRAYYGQEDFMVRVPETRRVLRLMDAVRESARSGMSVQFE